jgi:HEAT repeat protein/S1-C subfamily serine protease
LKSADDKVGARTACPRCGEHVTVPGNQSAGGREDQSQEPAAKSKAAATGKKPVALYAGIGVAALAVVGVGVGMFAMSGSKSTSSMSAPQFTGEVPKPRRAQAPKPPPAKETPKPTEEVAEGPKPKSGEDSEMRVRQKGKRKALPDEAASKPPEKPQEPPTEQTAPARTNAEDVAAAPDAEQIYKQLLKSTVLIIQVGSDGNSLGVGTGSLIDKQHKLVLTNHHVVEGASQVMVFFPTYRNGQLLVEKDQYLKKMLKENLAIPGYTESSDNKVDLAIVRLAGLPETGVQQIQLAHHSVTPGQRLYSVGNPTSGQSFFIMTSGNARSYPHHVSEKVLKHDGTVGLELNAVVVESQSPVNPGDSGGPVANDRGELVAVTESTNIGAAAMSTFIDISEIRKFRDAYYKSKRIKPHDETAPTIELAHDLPGMIQTLKDRHGGARRVSACDLLAALGPEAKNAVPDLLELIQDKDDILRAKALKALSEIGFITQADLPKVVNAMKDPKSEVRLNAILAIRHMGEEADLAVPGLIERLKDESGDVRLEAIKTLGNLGPLAKAAVPALAEVLQRRDKRHDVRQEAALAIGNIHSDDPAGAALGASALEAGLRDPIREVRLSSLQGLEKLGADGKTAVPQILKELKEKDREMRGQAVVTLGAIGPDAREAVIPLAQMVVEDKELRNPAGQSLAKIKKPAVNVLIRLLTNSNPQVRRVAIEALGEIGPDAGPLAAKQLSVLYRTDRVNSELIKEAVKKILEK